MNDYTGYGQVPVRVSASFGTVTRPVAAWRRLSIGQRIDLSHPADAPVVVKVNGLRMGVAAILSMDGHYGLELQSWGKSP
ncbi:MAG: FliM/FliN family flagellar motor switch protein [Clostridia bacterium]